MVKFSDNQIMTIFQNNISLISSMICLKIYLCMFVVTVYNLVKIWIIVVKFQKQNTRKFLMKINITYEIFFIFLKNFASHWDY